jgi:hypothetical protein
MVESGKKEVLLAPNFNHKWGIQTPQFQRAYVETLWILLTVLDTNEDAISPNLAIRTSDLGSDRGTMGLSAIVSASRIPELMRLESREQSVVGRRLEDAYKAVSHQQTVDRYEGNFAFTIKRRSGAVEAWFTLPGIGRTLQGRETIFPLHQQDLVLCAGNTSLDMRALHALCTALSKLSEVLNP